MRKKLRVLTKRDRDGLEIQFGSRRLKDGDRVFVVGNHPWAGQAAQLVAFEKYGLGWMGWRVRLDGNCGECYASTEHLKKVEEAAV